MTGPPRHISLFRWALVVAVLVALVVTAAVLPWNEVLTTLDPWVDGLRRDESS
ncbi:hypothetical protein [Actinomycetospora atypica]|uniref:Uncharacterized protein n=1 Tax=Actinomycetospora atypica TaxID=1290095 RepID=A0ABV9YMJ0_9PSEU